MNAATRTRSRNNGAQGFAAACLLVVMAGCTGPAPGSTAAPSPIPATATPSPIPATDTATPLRVAPGADVQVTTTADVEDAPHGVSLREALRAANLTPGPHTITFAPGLAGQTISLDARLPAITQDGITLQGRMQNGRPTITIDGSKADDPYSGWGSVVFIMASHITINGLNFVGAPKDLSIIQIGGIVYGSDEKSPQRMTDIWIDGNSFSGLDGSSFSFAILVDTSKIGKPNATIENVVIANNTFDQVWEALNISAGADPLLGGESALLQNIVIRDNTFTRSVSDMRTDGAPIELHGAVGRNNRLLGARVLHNKFIGGFKGLDINHNNAGLIGVKAEGGLIDDTLIAGNVFVDNRSDIQFEPGADELSIGNTIDNTRIVNNLFVHTEPFSETNIGIALGGNASGAVDNRLTNVSIVNNTITGWDGGGVGADAPPYVTGIQVLNTILATGGMKNITPQMVRFSVVSVPEFIGIEGNVAGDVRYADAAEQDFHLLEGSAAVDAGSSDGAPVADLECRQRDGHPDIGAFEFGAAPVVRLTVGSRGPGQGSISAQPAGVDCDAGSSFGYAIGSAVKLTPVPAHGSTFADWAGDADCYDGVLTMNADKTCIAMFAN